MRREKESDKVEMEGGEGENKKRDVEKLRQRREVESEQRDRE